MFQICASTRIRTVIAIKEAILALCSENVTELCCDGKPRLIPIITRRKSPREHGALK